MSKVKRIVIAGFGGQGVMLAGQILAYAGNEANLNSLWFPSYGPETRGGTANCSVTISSIPINSPIFAKADTLMAFNLPSLQKFKDKVVDGGAIIYNSSLISGEVSVEGINIYPIPANDIAMELGNMKVVNMVMLGAYLELNQDFSEDLIIKVLHKVFGHGKEHLIDINVEAIKRGKEIIRSLGEK